MGKSIVITSGKGGVGKSTITVNLGAALAFQGNKVLIIDGDTGLKNLDILMAMENKVAYDLVDVLRKKCNLYQAIVKDRNLENLYLLPTCQTKDKIDITTSEMKNLIIEAKDTFDYILIDSPAGIEQGFENSIVGADQALIIVNPDIPSVRSADRVLGKLESRGLNNHLLIINRYNMDHAKKGESLDITKIVQTLSVELIGVVPIEEKLNISINHKESIALNSTYTTTPVFLNIAKRISGDLIPIKKDLEKTNIINKVFKRN